MIPTYTLLTADGAIAEVLPAGTPAIVAVAHARARAKHGLVAIRVDDLAEFLDRHGRRHNEPVFFRPRGRPNQGMSKHNLSLDSLSITIARRLGHGNISRGIRRALIESEN